MGFRYNAMITGLLLALGTASAASAADDDGSTAETPRGQLVYDIVYKWAPHVQEVYNVEPGAWAKRMASTFATADLASLEQAAQATDFNVMTERLLATTPTPLALNQTLASGSSPNALGDAARDLVYVPVSPCRIIDTRVAGGVIAANSTRDFDVSAAANFTAQGGSSDDCGIGAAGSFGAAVINFTVVTPSVAGYITAYPFQGTQPLASTLNYGAGDIRGNLAIVKLDLGPASSELSVYTFAQTHLVADVVGYFTSPAATNLNCTNTSVSSVSIAANSTNFFNNPTCPVGYTATTPYCWTAASGVYSQGSGYNANAAGNATFCAWQNTTGTSQTVFGGNVCCRVPGN